MVAVNEAGDSGQRQDKLPELRLLPVLGMRKPSNCVL